MVSTVLLTELRSRIMSKEYKIIGNYIIQYSYFKILLLACVRSAVQNPAYRMTDIKKPLRKKRGFLILLI